MRKYLFIGLIFYSLLNPLPESLAKFSFHWRNFFSNSERNDSVQVVTPNYLPLLTREKSVKALKQPVRICESRSSSLKKDDGKEDPDRALPKPQVGTIPIEISVSQTGARCYAVPIATTEGLKLTPNISLQYNSQGGYGVCGYGWDLAGISKITAVNKNLYYHGTIAPAACGPISTGAAYALDGIPLVTNIGPLHTSYPLVTATGNILVSPVQSGQTVTGFHVLYPDGRRGEYGVSSSSNEVTYPIVSLEDIDGNKILYEYLAKGVSTGNQHIISRISYGIRGSQAALAEIDFEYLIDQPYHTTYYAGTALDNRKLLNRISSKCGGEVLCNYDLTYDEEDNTSFLAQVTCRKQLITQKLNPLKFSYYYSEQGAGQERLFCRDSLILYNYWGTDDICLERGRFLSEQFNDGFITYPNFSTYGVVATLNYYHKYGSSYATNQELLVYPVADDFLCECDTLLAGTGFQGLLAADVNGDGKDELIKLGYAGVSGDKTKLRVSTYSVNSSYGGHSLIYSSIVEVDGKVQEGSLISPLWRHFMIGDFLGTGKAQLMTISFDKTPSGGSRTSYCDLINLDTGVRISGFTCPFSVASDGPLAVAVDLEGDGKTEIVKYGNHALDFYRLSSDSQMSLSFSSQYNSYLTGDVFSKANYADINGDGYLDILMRTSGTSWIVVQNTGNGCVSDSRTFGSNRSDSSFMFADVDGNGFADLVEITSAGKTYTYINNNGTLSTSGIAGSGTVSSNTNILPANITHYNNASAFIKIDGPYIKVFDYSVNRGARRLLTGMVDGYGKKQYNAYDKLSADGMSGCYTVNQYSPLPAGYRLLAGNIYLLSREETYLDETGAAPLHTHHSYNYTDAIMNSQGLGFVGFNRTETYDLQGNDEFTWYDTQMMGVPVRRRLKINSQLVEKDSLVYDANVDTYKKMNPLLRKSFHTDILNGTVIEKEMTYGNYDFPITALTKWYNGTTQDASLYETYQYDHKTSSAACYILGSVIESNHNTQQDNDLLTISARKTTVSYDALMHPTEVSEYIRDTSDLSILPSLLSHRILTYGSYGDVLSDKGAQYGETIYLGNTMTYDPYGRTTSITDPLGHTTTIGSYNAFGKPLSSVDHKNRQTSWTYDDFGRLISCTYPDGAVESRSAIYGGGVGKYVVTVTRTGEPDSQTHFDAAGRPLRTAVMDHSGLYVMTDREYDYPGRLYRVSLPFFGTDTVRRWNTFSYDSLNRPVSCQEASGRTTSWSYNGLSTSETKEGITRTITKDAAGNVVSVTDPGGTITFALRDDGQPSVVTSPGNVTRTFKYDVYGRRTSISDPSLGTRTTGYSFIFNRRRNRYTTPSGAYFVNYDTLGRRIGIIRPILDAPSITYNYNADGLLSSVISDNGASETYTYDAYDRLASVISTTNNGKSLKKEFTYGPGSKVASIKYTEPGLGEICTENYTYTNGHHTKTSLSNGTTVYELISGNEFGFPTSVKTGTATRTYTYSNYGIPTGRRTGTAIGETYSFNANTGNLMEWNDTLARIATTYGYDSLNRLNVTDSEELEYNTYGSRSMYHTPGGSIYPKLEYNDPDDPYKLTTYRRKFNLPLSFPFQSVSYNTADRPASISQNGYLATINYDGEGNRVSMTVSESDSTLFVKSYLGGQYEIETNDTTTFRRLYIGGDYYSAPAMLIKDGSGNWTFKNIIRDYLGSVRCLADADGTPLETCTYDAWGEITSGWLPSIGRGYTGHEHLPWFGLINMNARLYEPNVGRFLSPDPYIQEPYSTQNYNRYAYALNNPLKYNDESGEIFGLALLLLGNDPILFGIGNLIAHSDRGDNLGHGKWAKYMGQGMLAGFIATHIDGAIMAASATPGLVGMAGGAMLALSKMFWASQGAITDISIFFSLANTGGFERGAKIWLGNFYLDENDSFWGGVVKGALRHTWEGAQNALGYSWSQLRNGFGNVTRVDYLNGATNVTVENSQDGDQGATLGNFINADIKDEIQGDFQTYITSQSENRSSRQKYVQGLYMHEFGHTIDSHKWGLLYLFGVAIPSASSAKNNVGMYNPNFPWAWIGTHDLKSYERAANRNASKYFKKYYQIDWSQYEPYYPL